MSIYYPEATPVEGQRRLWILTAVTSLAAVKIATELNAASSVDATNYLRDLATSGTQSRGQAQPRYGSSITLEQLGKATYSLEDIAYVHDPQGADSDPGNEVREAMVQGTERYLVERLGVAAETAPATTHKYLLHHVRCGLQTWAKSGTDEFAEFQVQQSLVYVEPPIKGTFAA